MFLSTETVDWDNYFVNIILSSGIKEVRRQWEKHIAFYVGLLDHINSIIPVYETNQTIFEIGSGLGGVLSLLHSHNAQITGSDVSKKAISVGRQLNSLVPYVYCNIETMIPPGRKYGMVLAFEVLEHLTKLENAIRNIQKSVRKGGYFIGTTPYPYSHTTTMRTHVNVHSPDFWRKQFRTCGFSHVRTYPMTLLPFLWRIHPKLNLFFLSIYHFLNGYLQRLYCTRMKCFFVLKPDGHQFISEQTGCSICRADF